MNGKAWQRNTSGLAAHAKQRAECKQQQVEQAMSKLLRENRLVNFNTVATSAGVMLSFGWIIVAVWCSIWAAQYLISKNIHLSNLIASIISPVIVNFIPDRMLQAMSPFSKEAHRFVYVTSAVLLLVIIRHLDHIIEFRKIFTK